MNEVGTLGLAKFIVYAGFAGWFLYHTISLIILWWEAAQSAEYMEEDALHDMLAHKVWFHAKGFMAWTVAVIAVAIFAQYYLSYGNGNLLSIRSKIPTQQVSKDAKIENNAPSKLTDEQRLQGTRNTFDANRNLVPPLELKK